MPDVVEQQLATRLQALGETVGDELPPPVDLELQVVRRRRRVRSTRRGAGVSVACAIVAALTTVAVVHGTAGQSSLRIATSPTTAAPMRDALQPGTVMLSARGPFVISLDANGHTNATMVAVEHGVVAYARATDDHRALWYLSLKNGPHACGDVVRADIDGRSSTIVTHAVAFDVSPDGDRLALYGAGDLAHDRCAPVTAAAPGRVVVSDLRSSAMSTVPMGNLKSLRWSPDGSYLLAVDCTTAVRCTGFQRVDVPNELGAPLVAESEFPLGTRARPLHSLSTEFGPDGLYALETTALPRSPSMVGVLLDRYDARTLRTSTEVFAGSDWDVSQVIPTTTGTYVVATPLGKANARSTVAQPRGLYRIEAGRLVLVRALVDPGTLTAVRPLAASG
jgi:hypothetical protein